MADREPLMREAPSGSGTRSRSSVASPAGPGLGLFADEVGRPLSIERAVKRRDLVALAFSTPIS